MEKQVYLLYINEETDGSLDYSGLLPTNLLKTVPKLGLQYLHAVLKQNNFPVILLDQEIDKFSIDSLIRSFKDSLPLFVGIYSSERIKSATIKFIKRLRDSQKDLIIVSDDFEGMDFFAFYVRDEYEKIVGRCAGTNFTKDVISLQIKLKSS